MADLLFGRRLESDARAFGSDWMSSATPAGEGRRDSIQTIDLGRILVPHNNGDSSAIIRTRQGVETNMTCFADCSKRA